MRSKKAQFNISVTKRINLGQLPSFIRFGHQGLEKGNPSPTAECGVDKTYNIPKDILKITIDKPGVYEDIESIEFTYSTVKENQ